MTQNKLQEVFLIASYLCVRITYDKVWLCDEQNGKSFSSTFFETDFHYKIVEQ